MDDALDHGVIMPCPLYSMSSEVVKRERLKIVSKWFVGSNPTSCNILSC